VVESVRVTLNAIEAVDAEWLKHTVPASWGERYARPAHGERLVKERGEKGQAAARALAQQVGQDGVGLLGRIDAADTPTLIRELPQVETLRTVWAQQFKIEEGVAVIFKDKLDDVSGQEQIQTPHDPSVRYGEKRGHDWEGYKVHITETVNEEQPRIITDVQTTAACAADSDQVEPIQTALLERDLAPNQQLGDVGYISGATMRDSQETRGIEVVGPARPDTSAQARSGGVALDQFEIDAEQNVARCPGGHASVWWTAGQDQSGETVYHIEFDAETCAGCPLRERCIRSTRNKGRKLQVKASHRYVAQRRKEQNTPEFKAVYKKRAGVEASLGEMVRAHGLRAARYVGQAKVHLQHLFIATATNLKRSARWLSGARPAKNRPPGLRSLAPAIG
jgi:transposase